MNTLQFTAPPSFFRSATRVFGWAQREAPLSPPVQQDSGDEFDPPREFPFWTWFIDNPRPNSNPNQK